MKTLLLDNLDSYTYNLYQLLAQVQGTEPVVVRNDAPELATLDPNAFDNIVISPGPGHPRNRRDFGWSARVLAEATVPVLGVCLGHQGIGLAERADVDTAPAARHGHLTAIRHDGRDLFAGLPQGFTAVRYHSLCIREPLPPRLEATAWAEDGVLMGVRHRDRPLWGVQFHPESVLTEFGHRLLANFRDLSRRRLAAVTPPRVPRRRVPATPHVASAPTRVPYPRYRLHHRVLRRPVDPELAFTTRYARARQAFWLDSSRVEPGLARFSFLGDAAGPLAETVRYDIQAATVRVERPGGEVELVAGSVFDYLKRELSRRHVEDATLPFDFICGYVGYLGYEMKADCGSPNRHRAATPDACWLFADRIVVVDHQEGRTYAVCLAEDTPVGARGARRWLDTTIAALRSLSAVPAPRPPVGSAPSADSWLPVGSEPPAGRAAQAAGPDAAAPPLLRDRSQYLADIAACKRALLAGESYEICLTNAAWLPAPADPLSYYRLLRRRNPAPYSAFLRFGDVTVASSSPERFLRIDASGAVESKPIKGTAPRAESPQEDARLRELLATDPKTRAENLMIVDLLRNDLGRICAIGTVHVPSLMATETYATVHQLVSTVRGRLRDGVDAVDCVRTCFPGGSMTGAPKHRTMEIIDSLETEARGVYSGAIGYFGCNGTADLNIVIRTAVFTDDRMQLGAGGAIVLDSDPAAEYDELLLKLAAPIAAYREWVAAHHVARGDAAAIEQTLACEELTG